MDKKNPGYGLRTAMRAEHAARVAANRAQGPSQMANVFRAAQSASLPAWHVSNWAPIDYLNGSIGSTRIGG